MQYAENSPPTDIDPVETQEWLDSLISAWRYEGAERVQFLLEQLANKSYQLGLAPVGLNTPYVNTITIEQQQPLPEDAKLAARLEGFIRWNAIAMVMRAGKKAPELGGHIASYASSALLYETGFNHFFHAANAEHGGDLIYIQGHSSPGIYARAFLEGRISKEQMENFRQEVAGKGISSYPHPWLMADFWQFPTVSMGLGPLQSIYQARFLKYLANRNLANTNNRKIWTFCGDGEMDEPESLGAITLAGRERLDNLIFVINCNLQRLDGPVRGNGKIVQELESVFRGAGWHIIKVIWGGRWDELLAKDHSGLLIKRMNECLDGEYQNYEVKGLTYFREHFFGKYQELKDLISDWTDDDLRQLIDGGHDPQKVYAAYAAAVQHRGQPTVILAKTIKGYGMGASGAGQNATHQQKKMASVDLERLCELHNIPLDLEKITNLEFYKPGEEVAEIHYLHARRKELGGYLPLRRKVAKALPIPELAAFSSQLEASGDREISTTMAFGRILATLLKDPTIGKYIIPIIPDESRTFGLEGLFRQIGIYSPVGQLYEPVDKGQVMYYREAKDGQLLQEGINEAGAFCSWLAAATSYSNNDLPLIPFYIYYSMFGFQRFGDLAWAAGDSRARGFLLGATSGRTTLAGEGLQHADGHNHLLYSVVPNCIAYDPTFSYELAVIIQDGLRRMYQNGEDIYYYITLMNENYHHPAMPEGAEDGIIKGMYLFNTTEPQAKTRVQLLASGSILREAIRAADLLSKDYGIGADIWSVTSFTELRREGLKVERHNNLHPEEAPQQSYVAKCLNESKGPVIAASDYLRLFADQIRAFIPNDYYVLGTDGFGRSDTRVQLRKFFEVNAESIAYMSIKALVDDGGLAKDKAIDAMGRYGIDATKSCPWAL